MLGRILRGHPPTRVLGLLLVMGLIFTITLLNSHSFPLSERYKEKALDRLCKASVEKYKDLNSWDSKARLSGSDLAVSMDSNDSKDAWSDDSEHEPLWDEDDLDPTSAYEKSAKMIATPDIIKGDATRHFRGK
jgi:hypothetical protein